MHKWCMLIIHERRPHTLGLTLCGNWYSMMVITWPVVTLQVHKTHQNQIPQGLLVQ